MSVSQSKAMVRENGGVVSVAGLGRAVPIYASVTFFTGSLRTYLKECLISREIMGNAGHWIGWVTRTYAVPQPVFSARSEGAKCFPVILLLASPIVWLMVAMR